MMSSINQLKLPYVFEVEPEVWNRALDEILRKSVIGSLIIIGISLVISFLFSMSLPTLIFIIVFSVLFFAKRKEIASLGEIGGHRYQLTAYDIAIISPESSARLLHFDDIKEVNKAAFGLVIIPKIEDKESFTYLRLLSILKTLLID